MEMQDISKENERSGEDEGASEPKLDVKPQEEAETEHYAKLESPTEDVYAETFYSEAPLKPRRDKKDEASENLSSKLSVELEGEKGNQDEGNTRLYRAACLFLSIVCLVLLLVIIVLGVKLQTGSSLCSEGKETSAVDRNNLPPTCSLEACQHQFPNIQYKSKGCQQCAPGWVPYGRSCYFLSTFRLSWADSQRNCSSSGGSLAVITSQDIQDFLTTKGNLMYWIGLKHTDSNWNWVDKSPLQKSYWTDASAGGDCALLNTESRSKKNWIRANCQSSTYFICHLQM